MQLGLPGFCHKQIIYQLNYNVEIIHAKLTHFVAILFDKLLKSIFIHAACVMCGLLR